MQVLVKGLWRTETCCIYGTQVDIRCRVVSQGDSRRWNEEVFRAVVPVVQTTTDKESPLVELELTLCNGTSCVDMLLGTHRGISECYITERVIEEVVVVVLKTRSQLKELDTIEVLSSDYGCKSVGLTVCVRVIVGAVVALTLG